MLHLSIQTQLEMEGKGIADQEPQPSLVVREQRSPWASLVLVHTQRARLKHH